MTLLQDSAIVPRRLGEDADERRRAAHGKRAGRDRERLPAFAERRFGHVAHSDNYFAKLPNQLVAHQNMPLTIGGVDSPSRFRPVLKRAVAGPTWPRRPPRRQRAFPLVLIS